MKKIVFKIQTRSLTTVPQIQPLCMCLQQVAFYWFLTFTMKAWGRARAWSLDLSPDVLMGMTMVHA